MTEGRPAPPTEVVARRLEALYRRIEVAGGDPAAIAVVAVTKGFDSTAVDAAVALGVIDVGENYAAELLAKALQRPLQDTGTVLWHYLGVVQRRKVRDLAPVVACWQSVCRLVEGEAIVRHAPGAAVLVEVDLSGVPGRNGVAPDGVGDLVASLSALGLDVQGLMAVGPTGPPERARAGFRWLARRAGDLGLATVSMGMSDDLEVAVAEGATMVRVGRALFGPRDPGVP
ncbi:MAG: YggS family pyridoxal phosphate enzyme [Acidimicrobiales bacterium]